MRHIVAFYRRRHSATSTDNRRRFGDVRPLGDKAQYVANTYVDTIAVDPFRERDDAIDAVKRSLSPHRLNPRDRLLFHKHGMCTATEATLSTVFSVLKMICSGNKWIQPLKTYFIHTPTVETDQIPIIGYHRQTSFHALEPRIRDEKIIFQDQCRAIGGFVIQNMKKCPGETGYATTSSCLIFPFYTRVSRRVANPRAL